MEDIKEKTADELFSELGYEYWADNNECIFYKGKSKNIIFDKVLKDLCLPNKCKLSIDISMQELQAINKKCQELRLVRR